MQRPQNHSDSHQSAMKKLKSKYGALREINHFKFSVLDGEFQILDKLGEGTFG